MNLCSDKAISDREVEGTGVGYPPPPPRRTSGGGRKSRGGTKDYRM